MRYPNHYAWFVLASTLDVIVTHTILHYFAGREVNKIADALIQRFGLWGMIALKYVVVIIFVLFCEYVGRHHPARGKFLVTVGIIVSALPVGYGLLQIWAWAR